MVTESLILQVSTRCGEVQRRVLMHWSGSAPVSGRYGEHTGGFLGARDLLAALLLLCWRWTEWVPPRGHAPWGQGAFLRGRRLRCSRSFVAYTGLGAVHREGWRRGAPSSVEKLGDAGEPLFVEVVDGMVVQELPRQE